MALTSSFFRDDLALQACAVKDSAHVTLGALGDHVTKIQFALSSLDGLKIDKAEISSRRYGNSTAAAVLKFKTKRKIINRSYQSTPDNIVGKMTIAALDAEMRRQELIPKPPGECDDGLIAPAAPVSAGLSRQPSGIADSRGAKTVTAPAQLGGFIRVVFAITLKSAQQDGYPLSAHIEFARDRLFENGIALEVAVRQGFADTLAFPGDVISTDGVQDNVDLVRKAFEDVRPGLPGILRVIVVPLVGDNRGDTFRNRIINGRLVPPFILLNSQLLDPGRATLLHEMIHCAHDRAVGHDPDPVSIFAEVKVGGPNRTVLKPDHARLLSKLSAKL